MPVDRELEYFPHEQPVEGKQEGPKRIDEETRWLQPASLLRTKDRVRLLQSCERISATVNDLFCCNGLTKQIAYCLDSTDRLLGQVSAGSRTDFQSEM